MNSPQINDTSQQNTPKHAPLHLPQEPILLPSPAALDQLSSIDNEAHEETLSDTLSQEAHVAFNGVPTGTADHDDDITTVSEVSDLMPDSAPPRDSSTPQRNDANTPSSTPTFVPDHNAPFNSTHPDPTELEQFQTRISQEYTTQTSSHMKIDHERMFEKYKVLKTKVKLLEDSKQHTGSKKSLFGRRGSSNTVQKTLEKWKSEYEQLERQYNESRDECVALKKEVASLTRSFQDIELDLKRDQTRAKFFESEVERLRDKLKANAQETRLSELIRERDRYKAELEALQTRDEIRLENIASDAQGDTSLSEEVQKLYIENKSLRQQLEAVHRQVDHRLDTIRAGTEKLLADITESHNQELAELKLQLEYQKNIITSEKQKQQEQEELYESINSQLKHQLAKQSAELDRLRDETAQRQQEFSRSTTEMQSIFEKERESLETELKEQRDLLKKWKQQYSQLSELMKKDKSKDTFSEEHQKSVAHTQSLQEEIRALSAALNHKDDQILQLRSQLKESRKELEESATAQDTQDHLITHLESTVASLQRELSALRRDSEATLASTREEYDEQVSSLSTQVDTLTSELQQKKHHISKLEKKINSSAKQNGNTTASSPTRSSSSVSTHSDSTTDALLKDREKRILSTESQLRSTVEQIEKLHAEKSALSEEIVKLQRMLKEATTHQNQQQQNSGQRARGVSPTASASTPTDDPQQKRINDLQQELVLQERVLNISRELEAQKTLQIQKLETSLTQAEAARHTAEKEMQEMEILLKDRIQALSTELHAQRSEAARYQQQKLEMERNFIETEKNTKSLTRQLDEVRTESEDTISRLHRKVDSLSSQLHEAKKLEFKLDETTALADRLKRQLDEKMLELKDIERLENELKNQNSTISSLEEEKKSYKLRIRRMEEEIHEMHEQVNVLRATSQEKTTHYENELLRRAHELGELQSKCDTLAEEKLNETRAKKKLLDALSEVGSQNTTRHLDESSLQLSPNRPFSTGHSPSWHSTPQISSPHNHSHEETRAQIKEELSSVSLKVDNQVKQMKVQRLLAENASLRRQLAEATGQLEQLRDEQTRSAIEARETTATEEEFLNTIEHLKEKINQQQDEYEHLMKFVTSKMDTESVEKWIYANLEKEPQDWGFSRTRTSPVLGTRATARRASTGSSFVSKHESNLFTPTRYPQSDSLGVSLASPMHSTTPKVSQFQRLHAMTYPAPGSTDVSGSHHERRKSIERKYEKQHTSTSYDDLKRKTPHRFSPSRYSHNTTR